MILDSRQNSDKLWIPDIIQRNYLRKTMRWYKVRKIETYNPTMEVVMIHLRTS